MKMSALCLIGIILVNAQSYSVFLAFELNKEIIIENLCENRDKPELECDGKCYLFNQMQNQKNGQSTETFNQLIFLNLPENVQQFLPPKFPVEKQFFATFTLLNIYFAPVFPPPELNA